MSVSRVLRRLLMFVVIIWLASTVNFFFLRAPQVSAALERGFRQGRLLDDEGPPAGYLEVALGLDRPLWQQYLAWLGDAATLKLGYSRSTYPRTVMDRIGEAIPWTIALLGMSTLIAFGIGTLLGALLAWPKSPPWLGVLVGPIFVLSAIPYFLLGLVLLYVFAFLLGLMPAFGAYGIAMTPSPSLEYILSLLSHAILPSSAIVLSAIGTWAVAMRSLMVMTLGEDFMLMAESVGLKDRTLLFGYAIRNALLPQAAGLALTMGQIVSGAMLVEAIFGYPGIGGIPYAAIRQMDYFLVQGIILVIIVSIALATLVLDLATPLLDPRVGHQEA